MKISGVPGGLVPDDEQEIIVRPINAVARAMWRGFDVFTWLQPEVGRKE